MKVLPNDWMSVIGEEFEKPYYQKLREQLKQEYQEQTIYPDMYDIFNALNYTSYQDVKVVILGQDPYHGFGQAHGLSFSVQHGIKPPPSLVNIFKEMSQDLGVEIPSHGNLTAWAKQGVLLLNTVLTVRAKTPGSHQGIGWEHLTNEVIRQIDAKPEPVVFILWGKQAQAKKALIQHDHHLIIESPHPSPFSAHRGFFGSRPFSRANQFLQQQNRTPITWELPEQKEES
ncbi:uracil-DNA glycosylase [Salsuginibacillus halophilus]|uniref:Uracil-DNA glycosylase n=1 Tax=Salsuginibacillus halophilus TaxID=517424 RepID=A0A2P8HI68_9BACI|nr:uracil-DNA glycosylase [Salsuginibacillus halophilus]PSL45905.1 uracil-DNA glycosylase [Salsuginibacillus halophilus]